MSQAATDESVESIAIIGMSGSFPGACDIGQFWKNLRDGVESIKFFSDEEHERPVWVDPDSTFVPAKGVLAGADCFDAAFFGYTPEEAKVMDPQHRLFLERGWEAIESAGYDAESYAGSIGVFAGVSVNTYTLTNLILNLPAGRGLLTDKDFAATRLSYKLNLRGPSVVVQAACSTSLVAVCMACQSLLTYQCDIAVAGGASIWTPLNSGYVYQAGAPLSPDGHCRTFDAAARGFVPGNGAGAVTLKRLSEALADGDTILAVIKGCALNNDGAAKIGYTAPSIDGQAEVVALALELAGVHPETITYVEAHGTGTELGDPIEVAALTQAFRTGTSKTGYCRIGSVKTNIGHLDAAAGIASLEKVVLCLQHRQLPASLHFERPNPKIDFVNSPFVVNATLTDWKPAGIPRRAGVSSFGIGGTNAHVIVEEAPAESPSAPAPPWQLLLLSAKTAPALDAATANLAEHLEINPAANLADVAYTLQVGRKNFPHRRFVACRDSQDACQVLRSLPSDRAQLRRGEDGQRGVIFLFPGQGSQHPGMARELYDQEPTFREVVDQCCEILQPELGLDLRQVIYPEVNDERAAARLTQTALAQPALFVIEYALAELWRSWGVTPTACIGHSVGEYVAACLAGVIELSDALRLVATRARLMNQMQPGSMLAVRQSESEIRRWLTDGIGLAAVNGPSLCVVSGPSERIAELQQRLQDDGVGTIKLHASHAFHSAMMDPMLREFKRCVAGIRLNEPTIPYISNLSGTWIHKSQPVDPAYWCQHLRQPVRFSQGIEELLKQDAALLEVGPGRTLSGLASSHPSRDASRLVAASLRHPQQSQTDMASLLFAAGQLWASGVAIDWPQFHRQEPRLRVPLPTYPFQRQRYWATDDPSESGRGLPAAAAPKKGPGELFYVPSWKRGPAPLLPGAEDSPQSRRWLVFLDETGLGSRLAERLTQTGCECLTARAGDSFQQLNQNQFQIDFDSREDYFALFQHLREKNLLPDVVAHLCGVTNGLQDGEAIRSGRANFYGLIHLGQALATAGISSPVRLAVVTDGAQLVIGDEQLVPEKAIVQGPCRVFPQELPNVSCRHIDIAVTAQEPRDEAAIDRLIAEMLLDSTDDAVAYRRGYRWIQTYEPISLDGPAEGLPRRLRQRGVYLVTGGLGGMGLALAQWLAETTQARLVLTPRTALPKREQWSEWLKQRPENDATSRRIRGVQALEKSGAEVLVLAADVCDEGQMRQAIEAACQQFGAIHGVIHAAGVAGGGVVQLKTREMAERVLTPKVDGLRILERALAGQPLDFLVLCSSLSALVGGIGQVDYCSANAFMDALAWKHRAAGGPPTISINWNAWRDAGMAVETELPAGLREMRKQGALADSVSNQEGVDALRRILTSCPEPQVAVTRTRLPEFIQQQRAHTLADLSLPAARSAITQARPDLRSAYVEPSTETEQATAAIWLATFGFDRVGARDNFFELGGHSLMALQLLDKLRAKFGVNLALGDLFEHKTVEDLARHIDAALWASRPAAASEEAAEQREEITL